MYSSFIVLSVMFVLYWPLINVLLLTVCFGHVWLWNLMLTQKEMKTGTSLHILNFIKHILAVSFVVNHLWKLPCWQMFIKAVAQRCKPCFSNLSRKAVCFLALACTTAPPLATRLIVLFWLSRVSIILSHRVAWQGPIQLLLLFN